MLSLKNVEKAVKHILSFRLFDQQVAPLVKILVRKWKNAKKWWKKHVMVYIKKKIEKEHVCCFTVLFCIFDLEKWKSHGRAERRTKNISIVQITLDNPLISRAPARPLARTNETKRFPGWGRCALTPPTSDPFLGGNCFFRLRYVVTVAVVF